MKPCQLYSKTVDKTLTLGGKEIAYQVTAGDFALKNAEGEVEATLFAYTYVRQPEDAARPVVFAYNGGPGSDSVWLHLGLLGPRRLEVADPPGAMTGFPYTLVDNDRCLLDLCDIVMIDPVGTGYSATPDAAAAGRYYGTERDGAAFARLIESWIAQRGRWDSPVYILGESYGTIRNLALADALAGSIRLAGIISVGTSFNVGQPGLQVVPTVRRLEAYAAAAWYHYPEGKPPLQEHLEEAGAFAYGDYARAVLWGSMLPQADYEEALRRMVYFTHMPEDYLRAHRLRVEEADFVRLLCPGYLISNYDSRAKTPLGSAASAGKLGFGDDPINIQTKPAFSAGIQKYLSAELGVAPGRSYITDTMHIATGWDYAAGGVNTMELLEVLMRRRPELRVMFINGLYDMLSTADFVKYYMAQYDIPRERTVVKAYESGHMTYFGASFKPLCRDLRAFLSPQGGQ